MYSLRTLVVDDNDAFRERFVEYLNELADVRVVGEAHDGFEAIEKSDVLDPDLIFIDLSMPRLNGFETMKRIRQRHSHPWIVIVTVHEEPAFKQFAKISRADGFISKSDITHDVPLTVKRLIDVRETNRGQQPH